MKITTTSPVVSTMTCVINTNMEFDIDVIYRYTSISDVIKGIKYKDLKKGETNSKPSFGNQVTFIILLQGATINVKVFNNKFQVTGIKEPAHAYTACQYLISLFKKINKYEKIYTSYNNDNVLLERNTTSIVGLHYYHVKQNISIYNQVGYINSKGEYVITTGLNTPNNVLSKDRNFPSLLRSVNHENYTYKLYNSNFSLVGEVYYNFTRKKRISIHNLSYTGTDNPLIFNLIDKNYNTVKGTCIYTLDADLINAVASSGKSEQVVIYYTAITTKAPITKLDLYISNCNASFSILVNGSSTFSFDMNSLYNLLVHKYSNVQDINIVFDPNRYSAIKIIFYRDYKGSTIKLSMCIFRSGKINVMGTRTLKHRLFLHDFAHKWFSLYTEYIIPTCKEVKPVSKALKELTIHDLL